MKETVNSFYDIKDLILEFEDKFPVNEWEINGIHIWPKIRFKLYIHLCQYVLEPEQKLINPAQKKVTPSSRTKGNQWWDDFKEYVLLARQIGNNKLIFFGHSMHRIINDSQYFNRFFDSMIDHHGLHDDSITLDFDKLVLPVYNRKKAIDLTAAVRHYRRVNKVKNKIFKNSSKTSTSSLELFNEFFEFCNQQTWFTNNLGFDIKSMTRWTLKISTDLEFYRWCFLKANPKRIVFVSYYGFDSTAAAMVSANDLGIETVEFQHGPITNLHMAYSHWTKVPDGGFNTMPLKYWVWDEYTARNFNNWIKPPNLAVVVNQPWLGYSLKNSPVSKKSKRNLKHTILYTLQLLSLSTIKEVFPTSLLEAMKSRDYHFLLRFHPRNRDDKETYIDFLRRNGVDSSKYSFQDPKTVALSAAMTQATVHITLWSGSLIEAALLNLPTIIFHEIGLMQYENYLHNDLIHYANPSTHELMEKLDLFIEADHKIKYDQPIYNPLS
ncbi:hypothetical protein FNJ87_14055 [Nonlabens mediterrranea]|uniref:Surface carbohydrate biosynthesis protein n=1 Tax=Nonlabens mediterrranea TaxID=1419947 RepID=A0ABS0A965_9FLAO|nr:hypothetical protein [Nonlabens mediterrranea]